MAGEFGAGEEPSDKDHVGVWISRRNRQVVRRNDPRADAAGREAWNASTRTGENHLARTPNEVVGLGVRRDASEPRVEPAIGANWIGREGADRVRAAARGAWDAAAFGNGDRVEALIGAAPGLFSGQSFGPRYEEALRRAQDQNRYDETRYPISRGAGEVVGAVGSLIATDGLAALAAPRAAAEGAAIGRSLPTLTRAEALKAHAVGAGLGTAGQGLSDAIQGREPDLKDYISAAIGGGATVSAARRVGPTYAAATGAAMNSMTNAALKGETPSVSRVAGAMTGSGYFAGGAQAAGAAASNGLTMAKKGRLGEVLTGARLRTQGQPIVAQQQRVALGGRRSTIPDFTLTPDPVTGAPKWVDAKFGPYARPTSSQKLAEQVYPGSHQYYYWDPSHVGGIAGAAAGSFGAPMFGRRDAMSSVTPQGPN